jgi:hypothetical protein
VLASCELRLLCGAVARAAHEISLSSTIHSTTASSYIGCPSCTAVIAWFLHLGSRITETAVCTLLTVSACCSLPSFFPRNGQTVLDRGDSSSVADRCSSIHQGHTHLLRSSPAHVSAAVAATGTRTGPLLILHGDLKRAKATSTPRWGMYRELQCLRPQPALPLADVRLTRDTATFMELQDRQDPAAHKRWVDTLVDRMQRTMCHMPTGRAG